ncbi:ORF6N domain-containing protein [Clostridium senegalense]|uniref:ORF6N domain-containing protein n=1 Tax=Clostridium senegalense TaxID=1465809 RepID=UPI001C0F760B|nr:ORF6N domain-containing protein [Clostridium senegalense]MBU5227811.1 ORF6N domain-containing protein [Clostridium senegalense]
MNKTLTVNDQQLIIKEYDNKRVVTMWDIAKVHGVLTQNIRDNLRNNQKYLIEGEDYYLLNKRDEFVHDLIVKEDLKKNAVSRAKDIPIFTETGYLMMVKPMQDELSWEVQRKLVNSYFKVSDCLKKQNITIEPLKPNSPLQKLEDVNKTIDYMDSMLTKMQVSNTERMKVINSLLLSAGIVIPQIDVKNVQGRKDKSGFITLEELAIRIGLYTEDWKPNLEAIMVCLNHIEMELSDVNVVLRFNSNNNGYWFSVRFNPLLQDKIEIYLRNENYPYHLEVEYENGNVTRITTLYRKAV